MLKSCQYCGRIHDSKYDCGKKPIHIKKITYKDKFRSTKEWTDKAKEIKERDSNLCKACYCGVSETMRVFEYENLSVHHVESLTEAYEKRLDNDNLITLCQFHHEAAEKGKITKELLIKIIPPG